MNHSSVLNTSLASDSYTDLSNVQSIRALGLKDKGKALDEIARQFESMLVRMMMKSMRDANESFGEDSIFSSKETKFYQGMLDDQLALSLTKGRGMGIAEIMSKQLSKRYGVVEAEQNVTTTKPEYLVKDIPVARHVVSIFRPQPMSEKATQAVGVKAMTAAAPSATAMRFDGTPEQFIEQLYGFAKNAADQLGVKPEVLIAQAALETGWGAKISKQGAQLSFNMFNIKADQRWGGDSVKVSTIEYRQGVAVKERVNFRAYQTPAESFDDYVGFIRNNPRYEQALKAQDSESYIRSLSEAGYATDPNYTEKIMRIANSAPLKNAVAKHAQLASQDRG